MAPDIATVSLWIHQIRDHLDCVFSYTDRLGRVLVKTAKHSKGQNEELVRRGSTKKVLSAELDTSSFERFHKLKIISCKSTLHRLFYTKLACATQ